MSGIILDILNYIFGPIALVGLGLIYGLQGIFNQLSGAGLFDGILKNAEIKNLGVVLMLIGTFFLLTALGFLILKALNSNKMFLHLQKGFLLFLVLFISGTIVPIVFINILMIFGGVLNLIFVNIPADQLNFANLIHMIGYTSADAFNKHFGEPGDTVPIWDDYNVFLTIAGAVCAIFILFKFCTLLIKRILDLVSCGLYFPIVSVPVVYEDNLSKMLAWKDIFLGALISAIACVISFTVFSALTPFILNKFRTLLINLPYNGFIGAALVIVGLIGGGKGTLGSVHTFVALISNAASPNYSPNHSINSETAKLMQNSKKIARGGAKIMKGKEFVYKKLF